MGAQVYQEETIRRAANSLNEATPSEWDVRRIVARSMRSPLPGNRRLPIGMLRDASPAVRKRWGALMYPRGVVHRMDLSLPPAPREIVTVHDTVAWRFTDEGEPPRATIEELRRAAIIVCVSQHTASDLAELTGRADAHVVYPGVDQRFFDATPLSAASRILLQLPERYVLHAGGASTRKNLPALAEAWKNISDAHPDVWLVLAGPQHPRRDELFAELPRTLRLGRVDDQLVPGLVAGASCVVVPSLYEGFGLPVVEAMAARTPVVAADTSSLPEVAGDSAVLVEPTPSALAEGMAFVLEEPSGIAQRLDAGRMRARSFSWEASTRELAELWTMLA